MEGPAESKGIFNTMWVELVNRLRATPPLCCKQSKMATALSEDGSSLAKRLELAEALLAKAFTFRREEKIQGMQKIEKQIKAEISMLKKAS